MVTDRRSWPLGCHTRPWLQTWGREALAARLPEVMAEIGGIGFAGFETTLACLPLADPRAFAEDSARANGLALCGAHAGGPWWDADAAASITPLVDQASRLPALGCPRLVVSMQAPPPVVTDDHVARVVEHLDRLGRACRETGVAVVFHNHAVELADDARIVAAIVAGCAPEAVALGPDLGWVAAAGVDVVAFLRRFGTRVAHLHARDVTASGAGGAFIEVGRGTLAYGDVFAALETAKYDGWLVAESEFAEGWRGAAEPAATARLQFRGLEAALAGWRAA